MSRHDPKRRLEYAGKEVLLHPASVEMLVKLIEGRAAGAWVPLPQTHAGRKRISRLREQLQELHPEGRSWIENDGAGAYRLTAACPHIAINRGQGDTP